MRPPPDAHTPQHCRPESPNSAVYGLGQNMDRVKGLVPVHSPLLGQSLLLSLPSPTDMLKLGGLLHAASGHSTHSSSLSGTPTHKWDQEVGRECVDGGGCIACGWTMGMEGTTPRAERPGKSLGCVSSHHHHQHPRPFWVKGSMCTAHTTTKPADD